MPRRAKEKFYGVRRGRDGPQLYTTWLECQKAVHGFSNSRFKSFPTREEAETWINQCCSIRWDCPSSSNEATERDIKSPTGKAARASRRGSSECLKALTQVSENGNGHNPEAESLPVEHTFAQTASPSSQSGRMPELSAQQRDVLKRAMQGESMFFTGSAGTGKSVVLREIISALNGRSRCVAVTASTGLAGFNIGGSTLHSFAGIGLGKEPAEDLAKKVKWSSSAAKRWCAVDTLIIDEISMIDGSLFDKLEYIAREVRENDQPFGGIQLVLSGDFFQLPPVPDIYDGVPWPITFAFEAESWDSCVGRPIILDQVFRQTDSTLIQMLNEIRFGGLGCATESQFIALTREVKYSDGVEATELYPLCREVESANAKRLASLLGPEYTYTAYDVGGYDIRGKLISVKQAEKLLERLVAVKKLTLKVGAQVMLIKNLERGHLVNGSLGQVIAFRSFEEHRGPESQACVECPMYMDGTPDISAERQKRARRRGVVVCNTSEEIVNKPSTEEPVWPVVRFANGPELLLTPSEFRVENAFGKVEVIRDQIPLILAWALSVHKSQGQTLERVKIDLSRTFECGQAYVALSRATSMDTLQVLNFGRSKVMTHPRVLEWHTQLETVHDTDVRVTLPDEMDCEEAIEAFFNW